MDIQTIIAEAKTATNWSANGKFNYGPIHRLSQLIYKEYHEGRERLGHCSRIFYKNLRKVTDAETFFVSELLRFDIYVSCGDLLYVMHKAFPEIPQQKVWEWINLYKDSHHVLVA